MKSPVPVGNNVGNAHMMYPSMVNSLIGVIPVWGHGMTCADVDKDDDSWIGGYS